jgi:hypothetical protein
VSRRFELLQLAFVQTTLSVQQASRFLSKSQLWEDCCNRPDDMDSRPDALIHKASITFKSRCPHDCPHGPNSRASNMEIACIRTTVRTTIPLVRTREALVWKLLAAKVRSSGRQDTTVRTHLKNKKEFQRNFQKADRTVVRPDAL